MKMDLQTKLRMKIVVAMLGIVVLMAATKVFYDTIIVGNLNKVLWVDGTKYKTIASCLADLPTTGGTCEVPPNYAETLTANLVFSKSNTHLHFNGPATITQGTFIVSAASGISGLAITSPYAHSCNNAGTLIGAGFTAYTGTAAALDFGDSSGFSDNLLIRGICVQLGSAGANAIGLKITNQRWPTIEHFGTLGGGVSGQRGIFTLGTGAFFTGLGTLTDLDFNFSLGASNNFGLQLGALSNSFTLVSGHCNCAGNGTGIAIDVMAQASGLYIFGFDADTALTAVTVESTVNTAVYGFVRADSGTTNIANFGAGSFGNMIFTNGNLPFTDNGTSGANSVINPARFNWRTDVWQNAAGPTFAFFFKDLLDSGNSRLTLVNGVGGDTRLDPGSGGTGLVRACVGVACAGLSVESNGTRGVLIDGSGRYIATETTSSGAGAGKDVMEADSTAHRMQLSNNNGTFFPLTQTIGSATVTTAGTAVTNGTCQAQTGITITGSLTTDQAVANINAALPATWQTGIRWSAEVSAAGTCTVNLCNPTAGSITPAATAVRCTVTR